MGEILRLEDTAPRGEQKFAEFWEKYPRKIARRYAQKCWERLSNEEKEAALMALPRHIAYWRTREPEFVPHASSWLNQGRWEDELEGIPHPCRWPGCSKNGTGQRGSAQYCQQHLGALDRGETPSAR